MNFKPITTLTEMILQDAKTFADKGDTDVAIKLWKYSFVIKRKYREEESKIILKMKKDILKEIKIKNRMKNK